MKWLILFGICVILQGILCADRPARPLQCNLSFQSRDFNTDFSRLTTDIGNLAYGRRQNVESVKRFFNTAVGAIGVETMRRYQRKLQQITTSSLTADEKSKKFTESEPIIKKALTEYQTVLTTYSTKVDTLVDSTESAKSMTDVQQALQKESIRQFPITNELVELPKTICEEFNGAYAPFQKIVDDLTARIKNFRP